MQSSLRQAELVVARWRLSSVVPRALSARALSSLVPAFLAVAATQTWFRPGTFIATGDVPPFFRTDLMAEWSSLWGHALSGGGSASFQASARAPELVTLALARALGWDATTAQRLFYSLLAAATVMGAVAFARRFTQRPIPVAVAGLVAFFNPFVLQHLPNPVPLWSIALMGFAGSLVLRAARGEAVPGWTLGALSVGASYLAINPPSLAMAGCWVLLVAVGSSLLVGTGGSRLAFGLLARALPWAVVLNLWWLYPLASTMTSAGVGYRFEAETDVLAWSWTHARLSLPNVLSLDGHWGWSHPEYFPFADSMDGSVWSAFRFALPALAFSAPILAVGRKRRAAWALVGSFGLLALLAKGLHPPLGGMNLFLYEHVPGMWLLREPMSKLGPLLVLLSSALVAISLSAVAGLNASWKPKASQVASGVAAVLVVAALSFNFPMMNGAVIPEERPALPPARVTVPPGWERLAGSVNADPRPGKALVLPLGDFYQMPTTWGFYGVDRVPRSLLARPTIQPLPGSYYGGTAGFEALVDRVQASLLAGDVEGVPSLLRSLGVSHVIVRKDLGAMPGRTIAPAEVLSGRLRSVPGVSIASSFDVGEVFRVRDPSRRSSDVEALTPWALRADDDAIPFAVAGLPTDAATVGDGRAAHRIWVTDPAVGATEFSTEGGPVRITPRSIGPQLVAFAAGRANDGLVTLVVRPAAHIDLDGSRLHDGGVATFNVGTADTVEAIRTPRGLVTMNDGVAYAGLDDPARITAYASSPEAFSLEGSLVDVRDCNASDPRSLEELGIGADSLAGDARGVSLHAEEHVACSRLRVIGFSDQDTMLVEFEHRHVSGEPARVCLWQGGPDRCAALPALTRGRGWQRYRTAVTPTPGTDRLVLFLYADGPGLGEPTRVDYRRIRVTLLEPVRTGVIDVPAPSETTVSVAAGTHSLRTSVDASASLGPFPARVKDCHAFDERIYWQAGLRMTRLRPLRSHSVRLRAFVHSACTVQTIDGFVPGGSYLLGMESRAIKGSPARSCLWEIGPEGCARIPKLGRVDGWTRYEESFTPRPGTAGLRLFLYADGGKDETGPTVVAYRNVRIRMQAPFVVSVMEAGDPPAPPGVASARVGPSSFRADVGRSEGPFLLSIPESAAPGWSISGVPAGRSVNPVEVDGYAQGWLVSRGSPFSAEIVFAPDRWLRWSAAASVLGWIALVAVAAGRRVRRRRAPDRSPGW